MGKGETRYNFRPVFPCPECQALRSRRYDLARHLVERHGKSEDEAKMISAGVEMKYEEITSKLWDAAPGSRYEKNAPGGK